MNTYCNREKASASLKAKNEEKRMQTFKSLELKCKICNSLLTFDEYKKGKRTLCSSKSCRSKINRQNSLKQDKTKISEQIRNSEVWIERQRESLVKKQSRIEKAFVKLFSDLYEKIEIQKTIKLNNGYNRFIDIAVKNTFIEIDGPYHLNKIDSELIDYCTQNRIKLIRVDVAKHWMDILSDVGKIIREIE